MMVKRLMSFLFCSFSILANTLAQDIQRQSIASDNEKIYIHFDRPYYTAGETIWFKAYLTINGLPSMISNEFYLQLEDGNGSVVCKKKYPIAGATIEGDILLADSLFQGYYTIRAITKNIALNDKTREYRKSIFIFNPGTVIPGNPVVKKNISLHFFPESGHLIDRIRTQVAFKATDETGIPIAINGVIKSDSTTVLTTFQSFHDGIGKIIFTPHSSDILFAEVEMNGKTYKFSLPQVEPTGIYLKITDADSGKVFDISRSKKDNELFDTVRLVVKMNNDTVYETVLPFGNDQTLSGILKTKNISSGILHFIVLDKKGIAMAERLSFLNNKEYLLEPEFVIIKRDSSKRGANQFELQFKDTVQRSFSVSVTDLVAQEFSNKENICSRLLLTSDLRGYVYNPAYYFEKDDETHRQALDNLLLTHRWTRYNWKKKKTSNIENKDDNRYLIMISGTVNDANNNKPVSAGSLNLQMFTEDSTFQSYDVGVDKDGRFKIDSLLIFGDAKVMYTYISATGNRNTVNLHIDPDTGKDMFALPGNESENMEPERKLNSKDKPVSAVPNQFLDPKFKQLSTVILKTKVKRQEDKMNEKYASALFRTTGRIVLDNINKPYPNRSLDVVKYILTNILTLSYDPDYNMLVNKKNFSLQSQKNWKVEMLVDEAVSTLDIAKTITMDKVAFIKFYEAGFVGVGTQAPGGAVAVYLKKFEDSQPAVSGQNYFIYKGYSLTRDFYNPDYNIISPLNNATDNRLTILWSPSNTGKSKDMKFSFFNNDISKKLHIVVEGFDVQGRLIYYDKNLGD